jgi:hypothetical protein
VPGGAAIWDSPITSGFQVYEYKVTVAGTYNYVCTPHAPNMAGSFTASGAAPTLGLSPSNQNVSAMVGFTSFAVTSNSNWTASSNASWCSVTTSGSGNGTIEADYLENTTLNQRIATITVTVSGIPNQTVTVTQAGATPTLAVTPPNQDVAYTSGSTSFTVTSNTTWTTSRDVTWVTVTPSGSGNGTITADFTENTTNSIRVANISVTVAGLPLKVVTITQDGSTVSVSEKRDSEIRVYPNPSTGPFKIESVNPSKKISGYTVVDITGKIILIQNNWQESSMSIDLNNQPEGSYFLKIATEQGEVLKKLVINR